MKKPTKNFKKQMNGKWMFRSLFTTKTKNNRKFQNPKVFLEIVNFYILHENLKRG